MAVPPVIRDAVMELQALSEVTPDYIDVLSEAERAAITEVETAGYERLGVGTDRIVFGLDGSTVVKLARPPHGSYDGRKANAAEMAQWQNATAEQRTVLAPIYDVGGGNSWLTMERATAIRGYEHEIRDAFKQRCDEVNVRRNADTLCWNVGYIESRGHDCFIDYPNVF